MENEPAPVYDCARDGEVPARFVAGCKGDRTAAAARWAATAAWRRRERIDELLDEPQPKFKHIKPHYPQHVHRRARNGYLVYYEQPGQANLKALTEFATLDELLRSYLFLTEWIWRVEEPREEGKLVSVWDMTGTSMSTLQGDSLKMLKQTMAVISAHYPERSDKLFIVNAPWYFAGMWKLIQNLVDPRTREKISILGSDYQATLCEYVGAENVPRAFGGTDPTPLGESPEELALQAFIEARLHGPPTPTPATVPAPAAAAASWSDSAAAPAASTTAAASASAVEALQGHKGESSNSSNDMVASPGAGVGVSNSSGDRHNQSGSGSNNTTSSNNSSSNECAEDATTSPLTQDYASGDDDDDDGGSETDYESAVEDDEEEEAENAARASGVAAPAEDGATAAATAAAVVAAPWPGLAARWSEDEAELENNALGNLETNGNSDGSGSGTSNVSSSTASAVTTAAVHQAPNNVSAAETGTLKYNHLMAATSSSAAVSMNGAMASSRSPPPSPAGPPPSSSSSSSSAGHSEEGPVTVEALMQRVERAGRAAELTAESARALTRLCASKQAHVEEVMHRRQGLAEELTRVILADDHAIVRLPEDEAGNGELGPSNLSGVGGGGSGSDEQRRSGSSADSARTAASAAAAGAGPVTTAAEEASARADAESAALAAADAIYWSNASSSSSSSSGNSSQLHQGSSLQNGASGNSQSTGRPNNMENSGRPPPPLPLPVEGPASSINPTTSARSGGSSYSGGINFDDEQEEDGYHLPGDIGDVGCFGGGGGLSAGSMLGDLPPPPRAPRTVVSLTLTMELERLKVEAEKLVAQERAARVELEATREAAEAASRDAASWRAAKEDAAKALSELLAAALEAA